MDVSNCGRYIPYAIECTQDPRQRVCVHHVAYPAVPRSINKSIRKTDDCIDADDHGEWRMTCNDDEGDEMAQRAKDGYTPLAEAHMKLIDESCGQGVACERGDEHNRDSSRRESILSPNLVQSVELSTDMRAVLQTEPGPMQNVSFHNLKLKNVSYTICRIVRTNNGKAHERSHDAPSVDRRLIPLLLRPHHCRILRRLKARLPVFSLFYVRRG